VGVRWRWRTSRFERAALPHIAALYRFARQVAGPDAAPDLVQETFLRAWKYFGSFDPVTNCRAWLFSILRNAWADRWRRQRLEMPLPNEETGIEPYYDWEDEILRNQLPQEIEAALAQLPEEYRWAVLLADVEELSYQEITHVMRCPIGTVMSRINRGRRMLARSLRTCHEQRVMRQQQTGKSR